MNILLRMIRVDKELWSIVDTENGEGIRVIHGPYTEWPILQPRPIQSGFGFTQPLPDILYCAYSFNGKRSMPFPNRNVPKVVTDVVQKILLERIV